MNTYIQYRYILCVCDCTFFMYERVSVSVPLFVCVCLCVCASTWVCMCIWKTYSREPLLGLSLNSLHKGVHKFCLALAVQQEHGAFIQPFFFCPVFF